MILFIQNVPYQQTGQLTKVFKVDSLNNYKVQCKSESKFHYFPLWRKNKGGLIKKIFAF